jgi:hypothetical protein
MRSVRSECITPPESVKPFKSFEFPPRAIACLLMLACLGGCACLGLGSREVNVPFNELAERVSARFPIERSVAGLLDVKLMRPRFTSEGSRLVMSLDADVRLPNLLSGNVARSVWGTLSLSGVPRIDAASQAVFLDDARLDRVRVENMPDAISAALGRAASQLAREQLNERPIYTLNQTQRDKLARFVGKRTLQIEVGAQQLRFVARD